MRFLCVVALLVFTFGMKAFAALPDDIVVYFSFSEGKGNEVKDSSKYGNNGEIVGDAEWVQGEHDGALELDGATGMVSVPGSDLLIDLEAPMTVGAILEIVEFPIDWQSLAAMYPNDKCSNDDRVNGWKCGFYNQNPTLTRWLDTDYNATSVILETDKWYYLVYVFNSKEAKFYVDGELMQSMPAPDLEGIEVNSPLHIGVEEGIGNYYLHAILDEFWISNIEKSEEEIKELASPETILSVNIKGKLTTVWGSIKVLD
jgi:hypothetical protein